MARVNGARTLSGGLAGPHEAQHSPCDLDVHVFSREGKYYGFDARTFSILEMHAHGAAVLAAMPGRSFSELLDVLSPEIPPEVIAASYARLTSLIRANTLSSGPVSRPRRPLFHRIVLMLAGGCNLACTYCFERHSPVRGDGLLMRQSTAKEVLAWFFRRHEGPEAYVQLYGGEPLLNWSVLQYVVAELSNWATSTGVTVTIHMITNGTLLDPARIAFLKAHRVSVQVSVDGDEDGHDRFRRFKSGGPTFEVIRGNLAELKRQGVRFNLRAVLTKANRNPGRIMDALRACGSDFVSFEVVATEDRAARLARSDWGSLHGDYEEFLGRPFRAWSLLPHEVREMITRICDCRRLFYGCGAGVSEFTVSPSGDIYECQRLLGQSLAKVSDDLSPERLDRGFQTVVDDKPGCRSCWARHLCGGGCVHQAITEHGTAAPPDDYCRMKRAAAETAIVNIRQIKGAEEA